MLKYFDESVEKSVTNNLLSDDLLSDNLLSDNNSAYINSNIHIDTKVKSNPDKNIIGGKFLEKNFRINIKDLFQYIRNQTTYKKLTKNLLK